MDKGVLRITVFVGASIQFVLWILENSPPYREPWLEVVIPISCILLAMALIILAVELIEDPEKEKNP